MRLSIGVVGVVLALITSSVALPSFGDVDDLEKRYDGFPDDLAKRLGKYIAPGPNDSRGPCPALNTLANHGLINRNGKDLTDKQLLAAFPRGFGVNASGFETAIHNFGVVCSYIKGSTCQQPDGSLLLTNLTILGEPHAFEHDHSYSREDYHQKYGHGRITDNIYFNSSIFQTSLNVVSYNPSNPPKKKLANFQDFNEIRLQRESIQYKNDFPGSFQQNVPVTLFETGFIFGVTFDRDSKGNQIGSQPMVRLDWWNFWFSEESFPTQLGWVPASTEHFNKPFITSVSKAVLKARVTSTPVPLPSGALATTFPAAGSLPPVDPSPTFLLYQETPYVAPTAPSAIKSEYPYGKREADAAAPATTLSSSAQSALAALITDVPQALATAQQAVGTAPAQFNPYDDVLDVSMLQAQVAAAQSYQAAIADSLASALNI